jgi:serine/threonine protein kinase
MKSRDCDSIESDDSQECKKYLGYGKTGVVFLTTINNTPYACKLFRLEFTDLFKNEVSMLTKLRDLNAPNIVHFISSHTTPHNYIIMEYVPKGNLEELLFSSAPLSWHNRYVFMNDITTAVNFLHEHQIIHRDIKPLNILVTDDLHAKLSDFDVATFLDTPNMCIVGTRDYLAPEAINFCKYSKKTDIYALGITFWEIASRVAAFADTTSLYEISRKKESKQPLETPPECPPRVAHLIQWCLKANHKGRPQTNEVVRAVAEISNEAKPRYNLRSAK